MQNQNTIENPDKGEDLIVPMTEEQKQKENFLEEAQKGLKKLVLYT